MLDDVLERALIPVGSGVGVTLEDLADLVECVARAIELWFGHYIVQVHLVSFYSCTTFELGLTDRCIDFLKFCLYEAVQRILSTCSSGVFFVRSIWYQTVV